jgi:lipid A 3-O-deacylase
VGDTSQLYGGLTWDWNFFGPLFVEGTLGLAVHDGELNGSPGHKALGCRLLFRESVAVGARFLARHTISLVFAHISNADLCADNDGLDTLGIRYGYEF